MRFRFLVPLTSLIGALFVTVAAEQAKPAASTPATDRPVMSLFDGKSLTGWRGYKKYKVFLWQQMNAFLAVYFGLLLPELCFRAGCGKS